MTEEQKEKFGLLIDEVDNLSHALNIPMPPSFHVERLKETLPEKVEELKQIFIEVTGENPWE